jgi:hypothetical protein
LLLLNEHDALEEEMILRGCFVDLGRCLGKDMFVLLVCNWFLLFDDIDGSILLFFDVNGRFDDG